jgi:hypothetical protein
MESGSVPEEISDEDLDFEIQADLLALRDERLLAKLSESDRAALGDNPAGEIERLLTEEAGGTRARAGALGSFSKGIWCQGTSAFSNGVTCKLGSKLGKN